MNQKSNFSSILLAVHFPGDFRFFRNFFLNITAVDPAFCEAGARFIANIFHVPGAMHLVRFHVTDPRAISHALKMPQGIPEIHMVPGL